MGKERRSKFRPKEMAIVLSHYDLGAIHEIHSFRRGNIRSPKSVIIAETGKYLLKRRAPGHDDPYLVALAHDLQLYLVSKGFRLARLIGARPSNASMLGIYSSIYELFAFVEGGSYADTLADKSSALASTNSAGACLRWFHDLVTDYEPAYQVPSRPYHDSSGVRDNIQKMIGVMAKDYEAENSRDEIELLSCGLLAAYNTMAEQVHNNGFAHEKVIICHGDWHPGNMIFRDAEVAAVCDFDSAHYMAALGDVANGCLQFSLVAQGSDPDNWPAHLDVDRARSFLAGYALGRGISDRCSETEEMGQGAHNTGQSQTQSYRSHWPRKRVELLIGLMIEALIAEAVRPIAVTGRFAHTGGFRFLQMVKRKVDWLKEQAVTALVEPD